MDFSKKTCDNVLIENVNLTRATLKEAEEFKQILIDDINKGARKIIIDLSRCEFIDSTFLGTLVVTLKKTASSGGELKLIGFQPAVHSMFELTRLYRVFESYRTTEEALKSFQ